ncbi:MAG: NAD(P)-binding protein [Paracoccaceae bacterium]
MAGSPDIVIVGSGINALVAAALLGKKGRRVLVLERNDRPGGCMRTEEIAPGFLADLMAATFVLFRVSPGYAQLAGDLERHGFVMADSPHPTAVGPRRVGGGPDHGPRRERRRAGGAGPR